MTALPDFRGPEPSFSVDPLLAYGHVTLRVRGDLDCDAAPRLADALHAARGCRSRVIVLDMSQVTFIDSSGLHELAKALRRQRRDGGDIVLHRPTRQLTRVLQIVGLSGVFTVTGEA